MSPADQMRKRILSGAPGCGDMVLDYVFLKSCKDNVRDRDEGGAWQYFGSQSGGYTIFPAYKESRDASSKYDPRFRPWYVNALAPEALDVVIILDKSGSMKENHRMTKSKEAIKIILNLLRPTDRVAFAAFSSYGRPKSTSSAVYCQNSQLSFATKTNKAALQEFVYTVSPSGGTYYSTGLGYAKEFFTQSEAPPGGSNIRKPVLLFLSDGVPTDSGSDIMQAQKELEDAVTGLVIMTYGIDIYGEMLHDMANHNFGKHGVSNANAYPAGLYTTLEVHKMKDQLGQFYGHSSIKASTSKVQFTPPYIDAAGMGLMITASKSVYSDDGHLQGVVGYDITMSYLLNFFDESVTENSYAFLLNANNGNVLYHPNLASFESKMDKFDPVHYSYLEFAGSGSDNPIDKIIAGTHTSASLMGQERYKKVKKDNGFVTTMEYTNFGDSAAKELFDLKCEKTVTETDTSYIICVIKLSTLPTEKTINAASISIQPHSFTYHNFSTRGSPNWYHRSKFCSQGYRNSISPPTAAMKFSPRQFTKPLNYLVHDVTHKNLMTAAGTPFKNFYQARADSVISQALDNAWKQQDNF